jgi:hypothetical protein
VRRGYCAAILLFLTIGSASGITITVTGGWTQTIDGALLKEPNVPGSDFKNIQRSAANAVKIAIGGVTNAVSWRVDVRKTDINWFAGGLIVLEVRRKSDGAGTGAVAGGTEWQEVTDTDLALFTGNGNRANVKIQLRLNGLGAENLNVDTFAGTVFFTVTEL